MKFFSDKNIKTHKNSLLKNNAFLLSNDISFFDFLDKKSIHFSKKNPFQFLGRFNFAFDCFIMAMHFVLYLTYFYFYLVFGFGLKNRVFLPFYKFFRWSPLKLHTNTLRF